MAYYSYNVCIQGQFYNYTLGGNICSISFEAQIFCFRADV